MPKSEEERNALRQEMRTKKLKKKKIASVCVSVALVIIIAFLCYAIPFRWVSPSKDKLQVYNNVGNGEVLRVGVMSNNQLQSNKDDNVLYVENLKKTLEVFKSQGVDMIINAGDIAQKNSGYAYGVYKDTVNSVFPEKNARPIFLNIMGNQDLISEKDNGNNVQKQRTFSMKLDTSPWTHCKVNGFHFIGVSPDKMGAENGYSEKVTEWLEKELEDAKNDTKPGNPIFVVSHHSVEDSVIGSNEQSDENLTKVLSKYENVVLITGSSNYSVLDERSISQKNITAFSAQSTSGVSLEDVKFDPFLNTETNLPAYSTDYPMCLIMNIGAENTVVERWNVAKNKEEKANMRWTLSYPLEKGTFVYRKNILESKATAPEFPKKSKIKYEPFIKSYLPSDNEKTLPGIKFTAAVHPDFVHSYDVRLTDEATGRMYTYLYYTDFTSGIADMSKEVSLALDKNLPSAKYTVEVYAIDSYNHYSEDALVGEIQWVKPAA